MSQRKRFLNPFRFISRINVGKRRKRGCLKGGGGPLKENWMVIRSTSCLSHSQHGQLAPVEPDTRHHPAAIFDTPECLTKLSANQSRVKTSFSTREKFSAPLSVLLLSKCRPASTLICLASAKHQLSSQTPLLILFVFFCVFLEQVAAVAPCFCHTTTD